jgi:hypothetical protein
MAANDALADNEELATEIAIANSRLARGVDDLSSNFEDWSTAINSGVKNSKAYNDALAGLETAMNDILDLDDNTLSEEFLTSTENLELMR